MNLRKESLFYFDCEWVPISENLEKLEIDHPKLYGAFIHKCEKINELAIEDGKAFKEPSLLYKQKAHMYPELCQIICVSYGYFNEGVFNIKSVYGSDEKALLNSVAKLFNTVLEKGLILCGYAIKRFDLPFLSKRMMSHDIRPPKNINFYGTKPWDISVFDLPEVWGQGNMQESYTTFEMACASMDIDSSKIAFKSSMVAPAYYKGEIEDIKTYCELDVLKTQELAVKLINLL